MKLSNRLQRIHDQIPEGSRMADIGSDHALLPVAAIRSGKASAAVAGEVNPGPYDAACKQVSDAGLKEKLQCVVAMVWMLSPQEKWKSLRLRAWAVH